MALILKVHEGDISTLVNLEYWQKNILAENSEIPMFAISSVLEGGTKRRKKGMPRLGRGFIIGLNKNGNQFKEKKEEKN